MISFTDFIVCLLAGAAYRELYRIIVEIVKSVEKQRQNNRNGEHVMNTENVNGIKITVDEESYPAVAIIQMILHNKYSDWVEFDLDQLRNVKEEVDKAIAKLEKLETKQDQDELDIAW